MFWCLSSIKSHMWFFLKKIIIWDLCLTKEGRLDKIFAESKISDTYVLLFNFIQTEYFNNCLNELPVGIWQRDSHRAQCELVILHEYWEDVLWAVSSSFALSMLNIYEGMLPLIWIKKINHIVREPKQYIAQTRFY